MSLSFTYAKCNDGKWYKEPVWRGKDYFLCLDDDDPPEFVGKRQQNEDVEICLRKTWEVLKDLGIEATVQKRTYVGGGMSRCFIKGSITCEKAFRFS